MDNIEKLYGVEVKTVSADLLLPLRQKFLRQGSELHECYFDKDFDSDSLHFAMYLNENIVGICTLVKEDEKNLQPGNAWRSRGLAIDLHVRRKNLHHILFYKSMLAIKDRASIIWAYARQPTYKIYEKMGVLPIGDEFIIDKIGPHKLFAINRTQFADIQTKCINLLEQQV